MINQADFEALFATHGYTDFMWIEPRDIVVAQWVRMKCLFGCDNYGRNASCPPNAPPVAECRRFFDEYRVAALFHFEKKAGGSEDPHAWSRGINRGLLELEQAIFLAGHEKAFLLFMDCCSLCAKCAGSREECQNPMMMRPSPEAMAIDVFSTVRPNGYPIEVLSDPSQAMNRYAFLLIE